MIAANVLKKNGKSVYCDEEINVPSMCLISMYPNRFLEDANNRIYNKTEKDKLITKIV